MIIAGAGGERAQDRGQGGGAAVHGQREEGEGCVRIGNRKMIEVASRAM